MNDLGGTLVNGLAVVSVIKGPPIVLAILSVTKGPLLGLAVVSSQRVPLWVWPSFPTKGGP